MTRIPSHPHPGAPVSRRAFLGAAGAALAPRVLRGSGGAPRDARLSARPARPFLSAETGFTTLGPELERGALLYVPEGYDPASAAPLVVALHGAGGRAERWRSWSAHAERDGFLLLAPDARARTWDRVQGAFGPDVRFVDACLRYTFERCAVDPGRVALVGFSDGASYALSLGPSNGDLFTHLIAFSPGFSDPEDPVVGMPRVFISHGDADRVLPVVAVRSGLVPMFRMDGYDVTFREFSGGHEMPDGIVVEALDWLRA